MNNSVKEILERSSIIKKLVAEGKVGIVPAMYDVATGKITFYEEEGIINTVTADSEMAA